MAAVLPAIVYTLIGPTLALRFGNTAAAITMMRMLTSIFTAALGNGFVASVRNVALLFLGSIVVVPGRHQVFPC